MSDNPNAPAPPKPLTPDEIRAWLEYHLDGLIKRRDDEIMPMLREMQDRRIEDEETAGVFAENRKMALSLFSVAEANRKIEKDPFKQGGEAVEDWFRRFLLPVTTLFAPVEAAMLDYANRKHEAEQRRRAEVAEREAAEAAEAAARASQAIQKAPFGPEAGVALDEAAEAAQRAQKAAEAASAKPAETARVRGMYNTPVSPKTTWDYETVDFSLVPDEFKMLDSAKVRAAMQDRSKSGRPLRVIPGLRWVQWRSIGKTRERVA